MSDRILTENGFINPSSIKNEKGVNESQAIVENQSMKRELAYLKKELRGSEHDLTEALAKIDALESEITMLKDKKKK